MEENLPWSKDGGIGGNQCFNISGNTTKTPVVFIHGNNSSHSFWKHYINHFIDRGYIGDELWAVNVSDKERTHRAFSESVNAFVENVCEYCGVDEIDLVAHSLGVTSARYWMEDYSTYSYVQNFIGLCGANHGLSFCPPQRLAKLLPKSSLSKPCQFLSNSGDGEYHYTSLNEDCETPNDVNYYTIRGSRDKLFVLDKESPILDGAEKNVELDETHLGMRTNETAIELVHKWCNKDS